MYLEDSPIKKQSDDLLHRSKFAKRIGKSLVETSTKDGFCVGLFGKWGSGKSSVVNMILEEIDQLSENEETKPIVLFFNPWNFSSSDQLLHQYFLMMSDKFASSKDKNISKIGIEIQRYANLFDSLGSFASIAGTGGNIIGRLLSRNSIEGSSDISKQKQIIEELLAKQKQKILVVIDDIDRLSNDEIRLIFQLVNAVAKFPNTIYLLSFDKEIVSRALSEVQNYDGDLYLEKIIQVPIEIPEVTNDYLWQALFQRLNELLADHKMAFDSEYWSKMFSAFVSKQIRNIRDVIRLVNALNIKCSLIGDDSNFVDIIVLTIIEMKLPNLYRWIKDNKEYLVGGIESSLRFFNSKPEEIKQYHKNSLVQYNVDDVDGTIELLEMIFPFFASSHNGSSRYYKGEAYRREMRIGHSEMFDRYFALDIGENTISRIEIDSALFNMSAEELELFIDKVNRQSCSISFLKELGAAGKDIPKERIGLITTTLLNKANDFQGTDSNNPFNVSASFLLEYRIEELLLTLSSEAERATLVKGFISNGNEHCLSIMATFINSRELAFGRLAADGNPRGEKILNLSDLEECESLFIQKICTIKDKRSLLDVANSYMVLYLFSCFAPDRFEEYMKGLFQDKINIVRYGVLYVGKLTGSDGIRWTREKWDNTVLQEEQFVDAIESCIADQSLWKIDNDSIRRAVAYAMLVKHSSDYPDGISDESVAVHTSELQRQANKKLNA